MQISDIKHRQKSSNKQQNGEKRRSEDEKKKESVIRDSFSPDEKKKDSFSAAEKKESVIIRESFRPDVKFCVSLMCLALSVIVAWLHIQQSATLAEMRGKYEYLQEKSRSVEELDEKLTEVSQQCARLSPAPVSAQTSALSAELSRLQELVSGLSSRQQELQQDLARAVEDELSRTRAVASIRTDLRRVTGLQTELEALLTHTHGLEQELSRTERLMVKRIGDALAGSIARTSELKSHAESSGRTLDRTHTLLQQLSDDVIKLSERVLALESGRAKLRRTLSFTHDLKPTVFNVRQDLALLQPKLDDLTLRIGLLAADMTSRDEPTGDALDPTP
ncbi:inhibitor of nuclear factor kappa-B kinase-interacting protein isoform X1 [Pimephales promelas]|uniref:inhibitor of nuclear factor kappa-B kinase-interacting protein isoform X1 n=1 Tax=Pimephales promelas TaxID=90988 RepID=UPI0019559187|nr:inhibitor of nuclear factor kappa-B kinase-interacting protein isoform X1 [Pimephales promelas]KAG1927651.1 inhibitor of nuclear factor kappa-B kinase-interacting protein [Pimephales promelas]